MGEIIDLKTKQKRKPQGIPEVCYFRVSSPDEFGNGPIFIEWNAVSLPMLLVAEEMLKGIRDLLFFKVQQEDTDG